MSRVIIHLARLKPVTGRQKQPARIGRKLFDLLKLLIGCSSALAVLTSVVLAGQLEDGLAVYATSDFISALTLLRPLAEAGDPSAETVLGIMYYRGQGVPVDYGQAKYWLQLAVEKGKSTAQRALGVMYDRGDGVSQDYAEAARLFRLAAQQGDPSAQTDLGMLYESGRGVPQDYSETVKWLRLAAEQGDAKAQGVLGAMYGLGRGVPRDVVIAYMWLNLSAASGYVGSPKTRDIEATQMTSEQIVEGQRLSRECLASSYKDCPGG